MLSNAAAQALPAFTQVCDMHAQLVPHLLRLTALNEFALAVKRGQSLGVW